MCIELNESIIAKSTESGSRTVVIVLSGSDTEQLPSRRDHGN